MYSRLEVAACAKRIGKSVPTAWRWIREGCRIDEPRSLKAFLIAKQVKRTNIEKSRERRSESNQKAQRISPESSANAFAAPGNGQTLPSAGKRGAAAALERLEAAEESAHRRLQAALSGGDRFAIADAQDFWLKCSETLRRLDLAVETARREAETQIPLRVAQDAVTFSAEWLRIAIARCGGQTLGKVITYAESELRRRRKANQIAAGLYRWVHQGMRHTFCSNWLALHKDINKLVLLSGHDSVDTMWRHYFKGTTETDARAFWAIRPSPETIKNVVPF